MKSRYVMFANYNHWANERAYDAASRLSDADYRADHGAFFRSVHGTLNHLLVGDRVWMHRFDGKGEVPTRLDTILYDDFVTLRAARRMEDERISSWIDAQSDGDFSRRIRYRTISNPMTVEQDLAPALDHFFNHQTHHRGQLHCLLTTIARNVPSFDLLQYQRETGAGNLKKSA